MELLWSMELLENGIWSYYGAWSNCIYFFSPMAFPFVFLLLQLTCYFPFIGFDIFLIMSALTQVFPSTSYVFLT